MYALSLGFFRNIVRRRVCRLISNYETPREVEDDLDDLGPLGDIVDFDHSRTNINTVAECIREKSLEGTIDWEDLHKKLEKLNLKNPSTKVFQACLRLREPQFGLKYYEYLSKNKKELSILDLTFFSKILLHNKEEIKAHEKLLLKLYKDIRETLVSSPLVREYLLNVFLQIPSCYYDLINIYRNQSTKLGHLCIAKRALELNEEKVAFEFLENALSMISEDLLLHYFTYCIEKAKKGKFTPNMITKLVNICEQEVICFKTNNIKENFQTLFEGLKEYQDEYDWSISDCSISEKEHTCSNCGHSLLPKPLTEKEFSSLKTYFFENSFLNKDINLTTSRKELQYFFTFLRESKPYDLVIDGLNLMYMKKTNGVYTLSRYLNYFLKKGHSVLIITRTHTKIPLLKLLQGMKKEMSSKVQVFFASNLSEDDIFILQAALQGGLGTYFITGDNFGNHLALLNTNMQKIFLKWQLSYQYTLNKRFVLNPPTPYCSMSQLTYSDTGKYIWHLSEQPTKPGKLSCVHRFKWSCLQAVKK